jgi:hypothetical protein
MDPWGTRRQNFEHWLLTYSGSFIVESVYFATCLFLNSQHAVPPSPCSTQSPNVCTSWYGNNGIGLAAKIVTGNRPRTKSPIIIGISFATGLIFLCLCLWQSAYG